MDSNHDILKKFWGYSSFRPLQEEIINAVIANKDTLALLPTGGGKSICFQIPALQKEGICLVISPLLSLIKDQIETLKKKGIAATGIFSGMYKHEIDIILDNCIYGKTKFLYISPERLASELLQERIKKMNVNLIAVDEAHCISQWGYDFRPSYLKIAEIKKIIPRVPILALTATATEEVKEDIQAKLLFKKKHIIQGSFFRKNLSYSVIYEENKLQRMLNILNKVAGTSIVYVRSRKKTKEISDFLNKNNLSSDYYHGGLDTDGRNKKQEKWKKEITRVIVATNAFGMGIDKSNVKLVIHFDIPPDIESYYQEAGRAGRDENKAYSVILYNNSDKLELERRIQTAFPSIEDIKRVYQGLANFYQLSIGAGKDINFDFDLSVFSSTYSLNPLVVFNSLNLLQLEDYITITEALSLPSRLHFLVNNEELYKFQVTHPKYDNLIKTILRSYGGSFDNYVNINEHELSKRTGIDYKTVIEDLNYLNKLQLISYIEKKESPQIIFNQERIDSKDLQISKENLSSRKDRYIKRTDAILNYINEAKKCRSLLLLEYFGEYNSQKCKICNNCLKNYRIELKEHELLKVKEEIKNILAKEPMTLTSLMKSIKSTNEDKAIKIIQWLIDSKSLFTTEDNRLAYIE